MKCKSRERSVNIMLVISISVPPVLKEPVDPWPPGADNRTATGSGTLTGHTIYLIDQVSHSPHFRAHFITSCSRGKTVCCHRWVTEHIFNLPSPQGLIHQTRMALSPVGTQADVDLVTSIYEEPWWLEMLGDRNLEAIWHKVWVRCRLQVINFS